jgi:hypothetical protein
MAPHQCAWNAPVDHRRAHGAGDAIRCAIATVSTWAMAVWQFSVEGGDPLSVSSSWGLWRAITSLRFRSVAAAPSRPGR